MMLHSVEILLIFIIKMDFKIVFSKWLSLYVKTNEKLLLPDDAKWSHKSMACHRSPLSTKTYPEPGGRLNIKMTSYEFPL